MTIFPKIALSSITIGGLVGGSYLAKNFVNKNNSQSNYSEEELIFDGKESFLDDLKIFGEMILINSEKEKICFSLDNNSINEEICNTKWSQKILRDNKENSLWIRMKEEVNKNPAPYSNQNWLIKQYAAGIIGLELKKPISSFYQDDVKKYLEENCATTNLKIGSEKIIELECKIN